MSYLPISREIILAPTRTDLDAIGALMLWPDDQDMQVRAIETSYVELLHSMQDQLPRDALLEFSGIAKDATPLKILHEDVRGPFANGMRAAFYLRQTVGGVALGKSVSMKSLANKAGSMLLPKISGKTFENTYWPKFRSVAHFWAASVDFLQTGFPCGQKNLLDFLKVSEAYRILGESTSVKQASRKILLAGQALAIDPLLNIEPAVISFESY